jgi:hypothetical protein
MRFGPIFYRTVAICSVLSAVTTLGPLGRVLIGVWLWRMANESLPLWRPAESHISTGSLPPSR